MRKIGNVLYLIDDSQLNVESGAILLTKSDGSKSKFPSSLIESIVIFGNTTISSQVIRFCSQNNISLSYVSMYGKLYGTFHGEFNRCVLLRKKQYDMYNTEKAFNISKNIMLAKFLNSKNILLQSAKDATNNEIKNSLIDNANKISSLKNNLTNCTEDSELMGIEGLVAQIYFSSFDYMIKSRNENMKFIERSKRPPLNYCNAMLSFFYTLFTNDIASALETQGLDAYLGYNHKLHSGRQSLSLDILEEFRESIIDKFVITLINRNQINENDFENKEQGIRFTDDGRKKILKLWEDYKNTTIEHKLLKINIEIKLLPYVQSQFIAQYIRGDIEQYPPFTRW